MMYPDDYTDWKEAPKRALLPDLAPQEEIDGCAFRSKVAGLVLAGLGVMAAALCLAAIAG